MEESLDDQQVKSYIHLKHELNPNKIYPILIGKSFNTEKPISNLLKTIINNDNTVINNTNGIIIKKLTNKQFTLDEELNAFNFIIQYLQTYEDTLEYFEIQKPANKSNIELWFNNDNENHLFGKYKFINIFNNDNNLLIKELIVLIQYAHYLDMHTLLHKICYLIAYAIRDKKQEDISNIFNDLTIL
jgi:hypothetical protein